MHLNFSAFNEVFTRIKDQIKADNIYPLIYKEIEHFKLLIG